MDMSTKTISTDSNSSSGQNDSDNMNSDGEENGLRQKFFYRGNLIIGGESNNNHFHKMQLGKLVSRSVTKALSYVRDVEACHPFFAQDPFTAEYRKMKRRREFPCKLCADVFPNLRALKGHNYSHLNSAGDGPFRCNICLCSMDYKVALIRHMGTHNGDQPYKCSLCNYAFAIKGNVSYEKFRNF